MKISAKQIRHWERIARHDDSMDPRSVREVAVMMLIDDRWIRGSARRHDVVVTADEVRAAFEEQKASAYPDEADFQAFLQQTGQTVRDLLFRVRTELYSTRLREAVQSGAASDEERRTRLDAFIAEHDAYWHARTRCAKRYFVKERCAARRAGSPG